MVPKPGDRFSHYKVLSKIGSGGMGDVYLAEDTKLDRKVAVKFLNEKYSENREKLKRFVQEAKATSALNHPHILTVHEIDEFEGTHYIATEYIEGETLRDRLRRRDDPLSLNNVLKIGIQAAEALFAAHDAGIVHRDIKPENIMIRRDGYVKVLDFGLAKLTERRSPAEEISLEGETRALVETDPGSVMGTASYMSPEQAQGKEVDVRTDIWSLGVVLYEMLSDRAPFRGKSVSHTIVEIVEKEPKLIDGIPNSLQRIVRKALSKDRDMRYQTAKDLVIDLRNLRRELDFQGELERSATPEQTAPDSENETAVHSPAEAEETRTGKPQDTKTVTSESSLEYAVKPAKSRKVLSFSIVGILVIGLAALGYLYFPAPGTPLTDKDVILITNFENMTGESIFDGVLRQSLKMSLQESPFLSIFPDAEIERTLNLMKLDNDAPITRELGHQICQRQGLKAFITGTIAKLGGSYVVGLEAINCQTKEQIDIVQEQAQNKETVTRAISIAASNLREKLGEKLPQIERSRKPIQYTTSSLEALKFFMLADEAQSKGKSDDCVVYLKKAIEFDPNFAEAHARMGACYANIGQWENAEEKQRQAFKLQDRLSEQEKLGVRYGYFLNAEQDIEKAIEILKTARKSFPRVFYFALDLSNSYRLTGRYEEALEEAEAAAMLRPNHIIVTNIRVGAAIKVNRFDEAERIVKSGLEKGIYSNGGPLYRLSFINGDEKEVQRQVAGEDRVIVNFWQLETEQYLGKWKSAREFHQKWVEAARKDGNGEILANRKRFRAINAAILGYCEEAKPEVDDSLALTRHYLSLLDSSLVFAQCGESERAERLVNEIRERYPNATLAEGLWLPVLRAIVEMSDGKPAAAIRFLEDSRKYESESGFWVQSLRGNAYLQLSEREKALSEYQRILDNRGWAPLSPLYPLAQLGKARVTRSKEEYEKFFEMWKDADADLLDLNAAKKEYAVLN